MVGGVHGSTFLDYLIDKTLVSSQYEVKNFSDKIKALVASTMLLVIS